MTAKDCLHFFCGVDPAPSESHKSDDGAIAVAAAQPRTIPKDDEPLSDNPADWYFDFVYGRRLTWKEKATNRQWSGLLHSLHQRFRFTRMCLDPNGGGVMLKRELINKQQTINGIETTVTPIADFEDGPLLVARADFILNMFKRGDPGVEALWPELAGDDLLNDALYSTVKEVLDAGGWGLPAPVAEWMAGDGEPGSRGAGETGMRGWAEERQWALKCLDAMASQMSKVVVATKPDGTWAFTKRNAKQFSALGKKDLVSAGMYAYAAFLMWLKSDDWRGRTAVADKAGFSGWVVARR